MDFQNLVLCEKFTERPINCYSPPHTYAYSSWTDTLPALSHHPTLTDTIQMHPIRFPTPPITPPKEWSLPSRSLRGVANTQRTQSVIMKIGRCHDVYQNSTEIAVPAKFETSNSEPTDEVIDFMCSWNNCRRFFENLETLASHVNKVHAVASSNDGLYYCRWEGCSRCERGFNARYKMLVHVRTHTKEKPHHCHLCEKCFSRAENLKIHIRSHSGEKPYICTYEGCRKAYSNSSDRFKHSRTHSMEKPYLCKFPGCQKRYTDPSSLRKHVKTFKHTEQLIHTGTLTVNSTNKDATSNDSIYKINGSGRNSTQSNSYEGCAHYYVGVDSANICCMDVDELNYYYVADKSEPESYWIRKDIDDKTKYRSGYIVRHAGMDVEIEMPLDLRINRIV